MPQCLNEIVRLWGIVGIDLPDSITVLNLLVAVGTLFVAHSAWTTSQKALTDSKRPVLVFERTVDGWIIKNVGNGPALNLVFAEGDKIRWLVPYKVPSISKDGSYQLRDLKAGARLGVAYFDFDDNLYSSECTDYMTKTRAGEKPSDWPTYKASDLAFDWSPKK